MGEVMLRVPSEAHEAMRYAQLSQTIERLREAAERMLDLRDYSDKIGPPRRIVVADLRSEIELARADLEAVEALLDGDPS